MTTPNIPPGGAAVVLLPIHLSGDHTATVAGIARYRLPFRAYVLGVSASARASSGTGPTLAVTVKAGGTSLFAAPIVVTAGAVAEAVLAEARRVTDEADVTVDLTIGGTTPSWSDIAILLTLVRV